MELVSGTFEPAFPVRQYPIQRRPTRTLSGSERNGADLRFEGHTRGCRRHGPESAPLGAAADYFANFAGFFSNVDLHPGEQK